MELQKYLDTFSVIVKNRKELLFKNPNVSNQYIIDNKKLFKKALIDYYKYGKKYDTAIIPLEYRPNGKPKVRLGNNKFYSFLSIIDNYVKQNNIVAFEQNKRKDVESENRKLKHSLETYSRKNIQSTILNNDEITDNELIENEELIFKLYNRLVELGRTNTCTIITDSSDTESNISVVINDIAEQKNEQNESNESNESNEPDLNLMDKIIGETLEKEKSIYTFNQKVKIPLEIQDNFYRACNVCDLSYRDYENEILLLKDGTCYYDAGEYGADGPNPESDRPELILCGKWFLNNEGIHLLDEEQTNIEIIFEMDEEIKKREEVHFENGKSYLEYEYDEYANEIHRLKEIEIIPEDRLYYLKV